MKTTKSLSQDRRFSCRDLNPRPPKTKQEPTCHCCKFTLRSAQTAAYRFVETQAIVVLKPDLDTGCLSVTKQRLNALRLQVTVGPHECRNAEEMEGNGRGEENMQYT